MSATFTGGGLKLKGAAAGGVKKKAKKEKKADGADAKGMAAAAVDGAAEAPAPPLATAGRTEAQKKHDEYLAKRQKDMLKKLAAKSHRDRVQEFNQKLASLSEHHDIPKVGPG